jgi:coproporphyrinogen III oxidase-like Fe-S oxidoreductase
MSLDKDELNCFIQRYKEEINLPFLCQAAPSYIREETIQKLTNIGMFRIALGVESGSDNTLSLYQRKHSPPDKIVEITNILNKFHPKLKYSLDLILDNPWETEEDLKKTLSLLDKLPDTYELILFSLTFYPGTYLYDKAVKDGLIEDGFYLKGIKYYHKLNKTFYNSIFLLYVLKVNHKIINYLLKSGKIRRRIIGSLTHILLGLWLLKTIFRFTKNKNMLWHYIKLGLSFIKKGG